MRRGSPLSWLLPTPALFLLHSVISDWVSERSAVGGSAESSGTSPATEGIHNDAECWTGATAGALRPTNKVGEGPPPEVSSPAPSTELGC